VTSSPTETSPPPTEPARSRWTGLARDVLIGLAIFAAIQWWRTRDVVSGPVPHETVSLLDGERVELSGPRERPLLLHFEASWCGVCRTVDGTIRSLGTEHDVLVVASQSGDEAAVRRFADEHDLGDLRFSVDEDGRLAQRFGVQAFPTTLFVDRDGNVSDVEVGYTSWLGMRARLAWAGL